MHCTVIREPVKGSVCLLSPLVGQEMSVVDVSVLAKFPLDTDTV